MGKGETNFIELCHCWKEKLLRKFMSNLRYYSIIIKMVCISEVRLVFSETHSAHLSFLTLFPLLNFLSQLVPNVFISWLSPGSAAKNTVVLQEMLSKKSFKSCWWSKYKGNCRWHLFQMKMLCWGLLRPTTYLLSTWIKLVICILKKGYNI